MFSSSQQLTFSYDKDMLLIAKIIFSTPKWKKTKKMRSFLKTLEVDFSIADNR